MNAMGLTRLQVWWSQYGEAALHFAVLTTGVLSRELYERLHRGASYRLDTMDLTLALVGALVTFPALQRVLERSRRSPCWLRLLMALQYGFCWRMVLGEW